MSIHEYLGHGQLGLNLTHDYPDGQGPTFQVDGFYNLKQLYHANSFKEVMQDKGDVDVSETDTDYRGLYQWISHLKSAHKKGYLDDKQIITLQEIGRPFQP